MALEGNEKKEGKGRKVPFLKLFSFADFYDYVLMSVGTIGACVHGASVPVFFIYFGKIINVSGLAYLFPKEASHQVGQVCFFNKNKNKNDLIRDIPNSFSI